MLRPVRSPPVSSDPAGYAKTEERHRKRKRERKRKGVREMLMVGKKKRKLRELM